MTKRILSACAGVFVVAAVTLVAAELALRAVGYSAPIWYQPDALLGWSMRPGVHGWYTHEGRAYIEVSPAGFRDRMHALAKPAGVYRIAVLGDSAAEGLQLDMKQTFWWQMQEKLRACPALGGREVEAMNFSASGYGSAQEALLLESTAIRYQPDLVLLAFAGNDVRDNSIKLTPENDRPFFRPDGERLKLDASFKDEAQYRKYASRPAAAYRSASDHLPACRRRRGRVWAFCGRRAPRRPRPPAPARASPDSSRAPSSPSSRRRATPSGKKPGRSPSASSRG